MVTHNLDEVCENITQLIAVSERKVDLLKQMRKSLRLCQLLDLKPSEMGKVSTWVVDGSTVFPWQGATFHVRVNGVEYPFKLKDVHPDLWPSDWWERRTRMERTRQQHADRRTRANGQA